MPNINPTSDIGHIPSLLYNQILKLIPISSVEAIIAKDNKLLLLKRNNDPAKGEWWFPGGRIRKGESFEATLTREVKEETGLDVIASDFINVYSRIFHERHDITIVYLCTCNGDDIILNNEHSQYRYFSSFSEDSIHPYLIQVIKDLTEKGYFD